MSATRVAFIVALALSAADATWAATSEVASMDRTALAAAVKEEARFSWQAYERLAWGHDEVRPRSAAFKDWYGESLLMTPVDALDTLLVLGLHEEAERARTLIVERSAWSVMRSMSRPAAGRATRGTWVRRTW